MINLTTLFPSCDDTEAKQKIKTIGISGIVLLCLIVYFFVGFFNSYALFALPLCLFTFIYLTNRAIATDGNGGLKVDIKHAFAFHKQLDVRHLWLLALFATALGFVKGSWKMGNLIDFIVIACCIMVILDPPEKPEAYKVGLKLIAGFSLFYAASIWIQALLPSVYDIFVNALTNGSGATISKYASYYTGFTTSPSHTATYIAAGIFIFALDSSRNKWATIAIEVFLLISLFCTGMRMPALAVGLSLMLLMFMRTPPVKRKKLCCILLVGCVAALLLILIFLDQLRAIPLIKRTLVSIEAFVNGDDVSSGRLKLYRHAINLFLQNPILGIGWGNFRNTVVGTVTQQKMFEVHNIFLQLLCETGIIGCICFITPMVYSIIKTIQTYGKLLADAPDQLWTKLIGFGAMYQLYFLAFGMTDNILFYAAEQILYFISCSILIAYLTSSKKRSSN